MNLREVGALFLVLLTACAGIPRVAPPFALHGRRMAEEFFQMIAF